MQRVQRGKTRGKRMENAGVKGGKKNDSHVKIDLLAERKTACFL